MRSYIPHYLCNVFYVCSTMYFEAFATYENAAADPFAKFFPRVPTEVTVPLMRANEANGCTNEPMKHWSQCELHRQQQRIQTRDLPRT